MKGKEILREIKQGLTDSGFTSRDFAEVLGVSEIQVSRWFGGKTVASHLTMKAIELVYEIHFKGKIKYNGWIIEKPVSVIEKDYYVFSVHRSDEKNRRKAGSIEECKNLIDQINEKDN